EKLVDFAWRSEHEMTVKAKAIIQAFYGSAPKLSYWNGCSTGGRQGLKEAQKFPDDYDGIIAGAPANRTAISLWIADAVLKDPASYIPPGKYPIIHQAALDACDAMDGLEDGLIDDPSKCRFDPKVLLCKDGDGPSCLTAPQVAAAKQIYAPAINPRTGQQLFFSLVPGTELGWGVQALGPDPSANIYDQYRYVVFKDPKWDWKTFNFDSDVARGDLPENLIMNATDPNMKPFFSHGGKLPLYHGWSDPNVPTLNTIKYYNRVVENLGGASKAVSSVRLFLEPGTSGRNSAGQVALLLHLLQDATSESASPTILPDFHVQIGKRHVVVKHEPGRRHDLSTNVEHVVARRLAGMFEYRIVVPPA